MAYKLEIPENLDKIFHKLSKKDKNLLEIINNKIIRILENPYQFKPLRNEMAGIRRVHIGKSFVLTYDILEGDKIVRLLDYDHHDSIYKP
ncbi:MAG: type II toxin-antitoxin system mRNA interferase toxin, RelE/StbE family [Candidatus Pacearchaeota archaeon]|jgi:mRNA interferase RelE/StbE/toxin YoeB